MADQIVEEIRKMTSEIRIPSTLIIGGGSFAALPEVAEKLQCARPMIVSDPFLMKTGLTARLQDVLASQGLHCTLFCETVPDPTTDVVEAGVQAFMEGQRDSLISLGGGSPIDTAKAIGMLVGNGGRVHDYKVPNPVPKAGPPHIAVPTTAGTGSEVTRFTVITDSASKEKMLIAGHSLLPTAAVIDFELTLSMPARLTADTGIDSLTHAIEAYVSRKANPFTNMFSLKAMETIWHNLPIAFERSDDRAAREAMSLGATLAGIAFSNSSVALVHGMSRPLGAFFHVPHGLSNAMLLPAVTAFSISSALERYADCARALGIVGPQAENNIAAESLVQALYQQNQRLEVPSPKEYGIDADTFFKAVPTMAAQALASGSPQNNPRVPTLIEVEQLYRQVWDDGGIR